MKVVIDNAIPYIEGVLEPYAEVVYRAGSDFSAEDVRDADALIIRTRTRCSGELLDASSVKLIATATIGFDHIDLDYCREHGIQFYRRKSGGGCVYADKSNVMMSYITCSDHVKTTFQEYMRMVCSMLRELGLEATSTENNDILIGGRKVSGNAFYHLPGRSIVHGTMLFDTDMQHMLQAITPPTQKLNKHGVESVRQRITLLKEHTNLSIEQFKQFAVRKLCNKELQLTAEDIKNIETIEKKYLNTEFIYGKENLPL